MSYVMPPNNAIAAISSLNAPESVRRGVFDLGLRYEMADLNNTPGGAGVVRGWGRRRR